MQPAFALRVQQASSSVDLTPTVARQLVQLALVDRPGAEADTLRIVLADAEEAFLLPPYGRVLSLELGYVGQIVFMGDFVVQRVEVRSPPAQIEIHAAATDFVAAAWRNPRQRTWSPATLGQLLTSMAEAHDLVLALDAAYAEQPLGWIVQEESDLALLTRLGRQYDAVAKPAGGRLLFTRRGRGTAASARPLATVTLTPAEVSHWHMRWDGRSDPGAVTAFYPQLESGAIERFTEGEGALEAVLPGTYPDAAQAEAAALSALRARQRRVQTLRLRLPGNPQLGCETPLQLNGWRTGIAENWIAVQVRHLLNASGYHTEIDAERPTE